MKILGDREWIRELGSTGLKVSAVAIGGAPLGSMPENFGHTVSFEAGTEMAAHILESPFRVLDTANGYSGGESERRIGAAIARRGGLPDDFLVTTKVDANGSDYSGSRVRDSLAESRSRLGLDHLPMVYLHDPEYHDFATLTCPGGAVETLVRMRSEGEFGHLGLAGGDSREMARYLELGCFEVLLVHNRWTLVDHSAAALIEQAQQAGVAVVNAAIYGGGLLAKPAASGNYGYRPASPPLLAAIAQMNRLCTDHGTDLATAALQASIRDPRITMTIVGVSRPERLGQLTASLDAILPDALFDELADLLPPPQCWLDHSPN